jgi:hypothetical protein
LARPSPVPYKVAARQQYPEPKGTANAGPLALGLSRLVPRGRMRPTRRRILPRKMQGATVPTVKVASPSSNMFAVITGTFVVFLFS